MESEDIRQIKERLERHEKEIEQCKKRILYLEGKPQPKPEITNKGMSVREFLNDKKPKSMKDKILAMGYYFEKHKKNGKFQCKRFKEKF